MKNRLSLAGIIIILVFGIMGTGCDNPISISGGNGEYHEPPPEMDFFTYRVYPYPGAAKPETVTKITYEIAKQDYTTEWITLENVSIPWEKSVYSTEGSLSVVNEIPAGGAADVDMRFKISLNGTVKESTFKYTQYTASVSWQPSNKYPR